MTKFLKQLLNDRELLRLGGRYEGVIAAVHVEPMRNRFKGTTGDEPVIVFHDGWRLVPNYGMRLLLIEHFGAESNDWIGRTVVVVRHLVDTTDRRTGEIAGRWVRRIVLPESGRVQPTHRQRGR
jgi:hypothetical protein